MEKRWVLHHLYQDRYAVRNVTGAAAYNVKVQVTGPYVVHGTRDWTTNRERVDNGGDIEFVGTRTWGGDDAHMRITWTNDPDDEPALLTTIKL